MFLFALIALISFLLLTFNCFKSKLLNLLCLLAFLLLIAILLLFTIIAFA